MQRFTVRRLGYALGAEIVGLDFRRPLDEDTVAALRRAWLEHGVLCFPGHDWAPEEMIEFCRKFGELDDNRRLPHLRHPDHDEIVVIVNKPVTYEQKPYTVVKADAWHSDLTYTNRPATASFLTAKVLPEAGGDTMFSSMYAAYDTLSPGFARLIDRLEAVHDLTLGKTYNAATPAEQVEWKRLNPPIVHSLIRVHPETGRKTIFIDGRIRYFVGMSPEESKVILGFLFDHIKRYEFIYRHRWNVNDLLMWDNRCVMHYAVPDFDHGQLRRMQRCALLAPKSGRILEPVLAGLGQLSN